MKLLYITHTREHEFKDGQMGWKNTPELVKQRGHEVKFLRRDQWGQIGYLSANYNPDVVITIGIVGAYVCWLKFVGTLDAPIVHEWTEDYPYMLHEKYWYLPLEFIQHYLIKNSDFITTASPSRYKIAKEKYGKPAALIWYGSPRREIRSKYALKSDRFKILYVGEQSELKQVDKLIKAVEGLNCDLYLTDTPNPNLQKIAGENVHFLGRLPDHDDVFRIINTVDLCVVTEDNDSPGKLFEYWQYKKPVLAPAGKLSVYNGNLFTTHDFRKSLKKFIPYYNTGEWKDFVKSKIKYPKVPTWYDWVNTWLREVQEFVKRYNKAVRH